MACLFDLIAISFICNAVFALLRIAFQVVKFLVRHLIQLIAEIFDVLAVLRDDSLPRIASAAVCAAPIWC